MEKSVEHQMVKSLQLIPVFDEQKVTEWFKRSEKMAVKFDWPLERWVGLLANRLKVKVLEAYDKMSQRIWRSMRSVKLTFCWRTTCGPRPTNC